jgi:hypothetical protein
MENINWHEGVVSSQGKKMRRKSMIFVPLERSLREAGKQGLRAVVSWALMDIPTQLAQFAKIVEFPVTLTD